MEIVFKAGRIVNCVWGHNSGQNKTKLAKSLRGTIKVKKYTNKYYGRTGGSPMDRTRYNDYTVFYFLGVKMKFSAIKYHHVGGDVFLFYPFYVSFYVKLHNILFCFLEKEKRNSGLWEPPLELSKGILLRRDKIEKSENGKFNFNLSFIRFNGPNILYIQSLMMTILNRFLASHWLFFNLLMLSCDTLPCYMCIHFIHKYLIIDSAESCYSNILKGLYDEIQIIRWRDDGDEDCCMLNVYGHPLSLASRADIPPLHLWNIISLLKWTVKERSKENYAFPTEYIRTAVTRTAQKKISNMFFTAAIFFANLFSTLKVRSRK